MMKLKFSKMRWLDSIRNQFNNKNKCKHQKFPTKGLKRRMRILDFKTAYFQKENLVTIHLKRRDKYFETLIFILLWFIFLIFRQLTQKNNAFIHEFLFTIRDQFDYEQYRLLPLRYSSSYSVTSVITPEHPLFIAFQKSYYVFKIKQNVRIPLFFRCLIKKQLKQLKHLRIKKAKKTKHLTHFDQEKFIAILQNPSLQRGISNTPCLIQTKGNKPNKNKKKILKTYPAEQKLTVFSFTYLNFEFSDPAAPQTVMSSLLYFLIILSNSITPSSVAYLSQIFMGLFGNFSNTYYNKGILFLLDFNFGPRND